MKTLLHEHVDEEWTVVYDLDQLMMEEKLKEKADNGNFEEDGRRPFEYQVAPELLAGAVVETVYSLLKI